MKNRETWFFFLLFTAFLVVCFGLLVSPAQGALLFPLLLALLVGVSWVMGSGTCGLLVLVGSLVGLGLWDQWPEKERLFLLLGVPQLWAIWFCMRLLDKRFNLWRNEHATGVKQREKRSGELSKDIEFYRQHMGKLKTDLTQRQYLAACAKELGAVLDPQVIQARLVEWVGKFFPNAQGFLAGLLETDPVDAWVAQRRQALLCDDILTNERFLGARVEPGTRALMVAPLLVEDKLFGGLRVESSSARRFSREDLRILEALATLASMALDNAVLYHRVEELAVRDGLTGLLTHRAFQERLGEELLRAGRYRHSICLLMVDVDHFKKVNDSYGHAAGDEVLRRLSRLLVEASRPVDVVARYGGEEFCLLFAEMDFPSAMAAADKLRQAFARESFQAGGASFSVTLSAGVAVCPEEATTGPQLVRLADQRLYQAKTGGRNRVVGK